MPTEYGRQPARDALVDAGYSIREAAVKMGFTYTQVQAVVIGRVRPSEHMKKGLSELLDMSVEELFTKEMLSFPHNPRIKGRKPSRIRQVEDQPNEFEDFDLS